jgi:zinc/manganese transport system permease protein
VVGALLVLALLCTPAAAALRVTASPVLVVVLSVAFATTATVGGIFVAIGTAIPISPYVTTISFLIYLSCRVVEWSRVRRPGTASSRRRSKVSLISKATAGQEQS